MILWCFNFLFRTDFSPNKPEQLIEVSSCVVSVACHPTNPAIFAAGTMSGMILSGDLEVKY